MGRKSKAKQIVRELIQEKEEKDKKKLLKKKNSRENKKKIKEELKKEAKKKLEKKQVPKKNTKAKKTAKPKKKTKKSKKKKKKSKKVNKGQMFGAALTIIMLALLVSLGFLLFQKIFRPQSIAKFLPAENTLLTLELNSNFDHNQVTRSFDLFSSYPEYSPEKIIELINNKFQIDFNKEVKPWIGRQSGLALIKSPENEINALYFLEVLSHPEAQKFVEKKLTEQGTFHYAYIGNYLFFSDSETAIKEINDFQQTTEDRLYDNPKFRKVNNNLPLNKTAFLFINFKSAATDLMEYYSLLPGNKINLEMIFPFVRMVDSEGLALISFKDKFVIQSFTNLNENDIDGDYISVREKYTAQLTKYLSKDTLAFWGGENLESQLKRMLEEYSGGKKGTIEFFDTLLANYSKKYFGPEISLTEEILPLLKNEFAFAIEEEGGVLIYKMLIELNEDENNEAEVHKIADSFAKTVAVFDEEIISHTLLDGTTSREIVAIPHDIEKKEILYGNSTIYQLEIGKDKEGIFYSIINGSAIISNSIKGVKSSIDLINETENSLKNSEAYVSMIAPVLQNSDEVSYFNFEKIQPHLFKNVEIPHLLTTISTVSSGNNYFNDGISTITFVKIKSSQ